MEFLKNHVIIIVAGILVGCVGLYQFVFWENFPYNAMSLMSIQDMATSGIGIMFYNLVVCVVCGLSTALILKLEKGDDDYKVLQAKPKSDFYVRQHKVPLFPYIHKVSPVYTFAFLEVVYFLAVGPLMFAGYILAAYGCYTSKVHLFNNLVACPITLCCMSFIIAIRWAKEMPISVAKIAFFSSIVFALPISAVTGALIRARDIKEGYSYSCTIVKSSRGQNDSFKVLEVLSEKVILLTTNNQQLKILDSDALDTLEIFEVRKSEPLRVKQ